MLLEKLKVIIWKKLDETNKEALPEQTNYAENPIRDQSNAEIYQNLLTLRDKARRIRGYASK